MHVREPFFTPSAVLFVVQTLERRMMSEQREGAVQRGPRLVLVQGHYASDLYTYLKDHLYVSLDMTVA